MPALPVFFCLQVPIGDKGSGDKGSGDKVSLLKFILYSRSNCPLCEAMEDELRPFIEKHKIIVTRQYIDNEPALEELYGSRVPVLTFNEETLCEYFLDAEVLSRAIETDPDTEPGHS